MKLKNLKYITLLGFSSFVASFTVACASARQEGDGKKTGENQNDAENMGRRNQEQSPENPQNPNNRNQADQAPGRNNDNKLKKQKFHSTLEATSLQTDTISQDQLQKNENFMMSKKNFDKFKEIVNKPNVPSTNNVEKAQIKEINKHLKTQKLDEILLKDYLVAIISSEIRKRERESTSNKTSKISKIDLEYSYLNGDNFSFKITINVSNQTTGQPKTDIKKIYWSSPQTKYDFSNEEEGPVFTNVIVDNDTSDRGISVFISREISNMFDGLLKTNSKNNSK